MLLRDESGASAAEYALILGAFGGAIFFASMALGVSIKPAMSVTAYGPDGTAYVCTANCAMDYKDYCAAIAHKDDTGPLAATFSPKLPAGGKCNGETPIS